MALLNGIKRVVCGISGGVDSAVAASILKQKGFNVVGAFMRNWDDQDEEGSCQIIQENDYQDAKAVCDHLRIPFVEVSFVKEYWNEVFSRLIEDYEKGFTPNPDILCNRFIKFGSFYNYSMKELGADAIATGHYAQNTFGNFLEHYSSSNLAHLKRAIDVRKDQTLFLSDICQEPLRKTMFPLGSLCKQSVRQLALELGMDKISRKRDSVGICFIGNRTFPHFISKYVEDRPGYFVDIDTGKILGEHNGVHQWTIGQRCRIPGSKHAYYVCQRNAKTQTILAALGQDHSSLYSRNILISAPHWISHVPEFSSDKPFSCMFKFQHTKWTIPCWLYGNRGDTTSTISLSISTRAITPGQHAVFYKGDLCLGSAKILGSDTLVNNYEVHAFNKDDATNRLDTVAINNS